ncbi:PAS domain S-box protein [Pseudomonadota bacterium]
MLIKRFLTTSLLLLTIVSPGFANDDTSEITAVVTSNFPPYFMADEHGKPEGFAIDVMDAVAERSGLRVRYVPVQGWPDATEALRAGDVDVMPNMGVTEGRRSYADFTPPVETFSISIFVRSDTTSVSSLASLGGKKVGVVVNNVGQAILKDYQGIELLVFDDTVKAMFALLAGEVDAFVYPEPVAWQLARQARIDDKIKVVGSPLREIKRAIAVRKGAPDLHAKLSEAVTAFILTPQYQAIYVKWFGQKQPFWTTERFMWVFLIGGSLILAFSVMTSNLWRLNRTLRDEISTRMELQSDLKKHFEIYDAAINTPALGFWVTDDRGYFVEVNDAYVTESGYSREELLSMSIPDIEAQEHPEETKAHIDEIIATGFSRFRTRHRRKDGTVWPVEIVTTHTKIHGGRFIVFVENIEEKVFQEARLRQAARVYETMDQGVVITDQDNKITSINPATTVITGYDIDDLQGQDPKIFSSGQYDQAFYAAMWGSLENTDHWAGEIWDKRKDGQVFAKYLTINVIRGGEGEVAQYVSVFSDITMRKQAENDLRRSHDDLEGRVVERTQALTSEIDIRRKTEAELRKLSRAVEQSAHMVFITDIDGIIEYINPKFTEWMGYSAIEAIGRTPALIKSGETSDEVYTDLWQTILSGQEWHGELHDKRKDGRAFWASAAIAPVRDEDGQITHFIAVHEDITKRKEAEQAMLAARQAAEVANKAKTDLLANMSHELRTPLNAIIGFSETMKDRVFGPMDNPQYEEYAGYIHSSGTHLLQLINDILDVSAVEAGKLTLHEEDVNVVDVCQSAVRIIQPKAQDGYVQLSGLEENGLPPLHCDPLRLKQIFINLISNAVKFTPEQGSVLCDAYLDDTNHMIISVTDSGVGMDEAGMEKALDTFGQVDSSLSRAHEGTGLGLPLTKGLVELHGGTLELASEPGKGTKVTIRLPSDRVRPFDG